jgi:glycosyltransferase involved in cell wall biosynthesis
MNPRVSVILPVRNGADVIGPLIAALAAQEVEGGHEVIVVDDCSRDDTSDVAAAHGAGVVKTPRWSGAFEARNVGLEVARGEIIAFIDADCRPAPDWLASAVAELDHGELDLVAGHIDVQLSSGAGVVERVDFARYLDQERTVAEGGFGATANLFTWRRVIDAAGGFERESIADGDRILCLRATNLGYRLGDSPHPVVEHDPRTRPYDLARRAVRDGVGRAQLHHRLKDPPADYTPLWTHPGAWFPSSLVGRSRLYGIERLTGERAPNWLQRRALGFVEWSCVQLPMVIGNLYSEVREALAARLRRG